MMDARDWFTTVRWGDSLYASLAGSTARWDGWEPASWQIQQAASLPEPLPSGVLAQAQQTYALIYGRTGRDARTEACIRECRERYSTTCNWLNDFLPPWLRCTCEQECLRTGGAERRFGPFGIFRGRPDYIWVILVAVGLILIGANALTRG
jgi:hypothetical protein